jgi:hypothetical protein
LEITQSKNPKFVWQKSPYSHPSHHYVLDFL